MICVQPLALARPTQTPAITPRANPHAETRQTAYPTPPSDPSLARGQAAGPSTRAIDAAYDGVLSQLDSLAGQGASQNPTPPSTSSQPSKPSARSALSAGPFVETVPSPGPPPILAAPVTPIPKPLVGLGITIPGHVEYSRLSAVSERTEPKSPSSSRQSSPTSERNVPLRVETLQETTTTTTTTTQYARKPRIPQASRHNPSMPPAVGHGLLPTSPVRGPRPAVSSQSPPKKASELIRLFESRGDGSSELPLPPSPLPDLPRFPPTSQPIFQTGPPPSPSSFRQPFSSLGPAGPLPAAQLPKPPSPLSQVRTMIASWRARARSPSQRGTNAGDRVGATSRLFGRDRGWNVSIRRRRRHEGQEETGLAEQSEDPIVHAMPHQQPEREEGGGHGAEELRGPSRRSPTPSFARSTRPASPRALTGEVCS